MIRPEKINPIVIADMHKVVISFNHSKKDFGFLQIVIFQIIQVVQHHRTVGNPAWILVNQAIPVYRVAIDMDMIVVA